MSTVLCRNYGSDGFARDLFEGIDTSTPVGKMMFHIIASLAEIESSLISERTQAGLAAMKAKNGGKKGAGPGSPAKLSAAQRVQLVRMRSEITPQTGWVWSLRELASFFWGGSIHRSPCIRRLY
ncbi:recombinase family protein [Rothia sp. 32237D007AR]